jgi:hypothetical protein
MEKTQLARANRLRHVHEFFFSLNLGLAVRLATVERFSFFSEIKLQFWINRHLHLHPHSNVGGHTAFFIWALLLVLCIFLLLRLSSSTFLVKWVLRSAAGIVSLVALPVCWLREIHLFPVPPGLPNPPSPFVLVELVVTVVCALLYLYAKWPLPAWCSISLLILHFGFWGWLLLGGPYFWLSPFRLIFPLAGLCSVLAWGAYVAQLAKTPQPPKPVPAE